MAVWDQFLEFIRDQKRYASHTLSAYKGDLSQFSAYLTNVYEISNPKDVRSEHIRSYIVHLMDEGLARRSVLRKISAIKSFYQYMVRHHGYSQNPAKLVVLPKDKKDLPRFVSREAMAQIEQVLPVEEDETMARDRIIILLLYGTGMRVSELCGLNMGDINLNTQILRVTGKRNKQREIPFGPFLAGEIGAYLKIRKALTADDSALLLTPRGRRAYPRMVYTIVHDWLGQVTTQEKRGPHILRHTFATHMLDDGADLNAIKEILGHASLAATQVYTHNTIGKLKKVHQQAHPRA